MASVQRVRNPLSGPRSEENRRRRDAAGALILACALIVFSLCGLYIRSAALALGTSSAAAKLAVPKVGGVEGQRHDAGAVRGSGAALAAAAVDRRPVSSSIGVNDGDKSHGDAVMSEHEAKGDDIVSLDSPRGRIRIQLRPDLSPESVDYVRRIISSSGSCSRCNLYRAEKPGILQGIMSKKDVPHNMVLGRCPPDYLTADGKDPPRQCPPHDPKCGCHGPTMTRGMVAWAGGGGGPDFFFDMYKRPAKWWGNDHTVWGELADEESKGVVDGIFDLPATNKGSMTFLDERIHFDIVQER